MVRRKTKHIALIIVSVVTIILTYLAGRDHGRADLEHERANIDALIANHFALPPGALNYSNNGVLIAKDLDSRFEKPSEVRVIYNRVPKCGSSTMKGLLRHLQDVNKFAMLRSANYKKMTINYKAQKSLAKAISKMPAPFVFERHLYFVDFRSLGSISPIYINLIRDPVERLQSEYYFRVKKHPEMIESRNETYDDCISMQKLSCSLVSDFFVIIPFFCGQDDFCLTPSDASLAKAKYNLVNHYHLVGVNEEMDDFIYGMELMLPQIFSGAKTYYDTEFKNWNVTPNKKPLKESTIDFLKEKLNEEYDFYNFARQIFHQKLAYHNSTGRLRDPGPY